MRILHLSSALSWRGGEQQVAYLADNLKPDFDQSVFCPEDSPIHNFCKEHGYNVITYTKQGSLNIPAVYKLKHYINKNHVDLIHIHDAHAHNIYYICCLFMGLKTPAILSRRIEKKITGWLSVNKYNYPGIKKMLCVSDAVKKTISPYIKDTSRLLTVHSGIDLERFKNPPTENVLKKEYNLPDSAIIIGTVGALSDQKDHFTFIESADKILQQHPENIYFFIVGDGELKNKLAIEIKDKKLNDRIFLTGFRSDIPQILKSFDIFLFTSVFEGIGTSVMDALASGIPVVSTNVSGVPEMITDGENGFLCPKANSDCLAEKCIQLLNDKKMKDFFIQQGLKKVMEFTAENTARKTKDVYLSIIKDY